MTIKETQYTFLKETSLSEILLSLLSEDAEYSDYIRETVNNALEKEDSKND